MSDRISQFVLGVAIFIVSPLIQFSLTEDCLADGKVILPRKYKGSLEEKAQEAIIIFNGSEFKGEATEDLILKITVAGRADHFAWVIPFPSEPIVRKEDPALFSELFQYVESRRTEFRTKAKTDGASGLDARNSAEKSDVEVLSRKVIGDFEIVTVREKKTGSLNPWLEKEGFQQLENAEDVIGFYREKRYVFCCIKVSSEALEKEKVIDSHPLRFSFKTGGRDGIYFPMRMTGLQKEKFDLNLYVFYRYWVNNNLNQFGYENRGMQLYFRDFDTKVCKPNGGKAYSNPQSDPYLKSHAKQLASVTRLFQKLHPGKRYYLTNIKAKRLEPSEVRDWSDDLWIFPFYTNRKFVPYDVQDNGPASAAWPNLGDAEERSVSGEQASANSMNSRTTRLVMITATVLLLAAGSWFWWSGRDSHLTAADIYFEE